MFLIRDWPFAYEHEYELKGGNKLLEKKLITNDKQSFQLQRVRKHIRSCISICKFGKNKVLIFF